MTITDQEAVEPCPFCQNATALAINHANRPEGNAVWWVDCLNCRTFGPEGESRIDAITKWNARAAPPAPVVDDAMIERGKPVPLRYVAAPEVTEKQREECVSSGLAKHGDCKLVWVNEGDLIYHSAGFCSAPPTPTVTKERISRLIQINLGTVKGHADDLAESILAALQVKP